MHAVSLLTISLVSNGVLLPNIGGNRAEFLSNGYPKGLVPGWFIIYFELVMPY